MEKNNIFTIIVLVYNNMKYIWECLDSILEQSYEQIEIIINDDCSEIFDRELIEEYIIKNKRDNIVSIKINQNEINLGTVKNINKGIVSANGNYHMILACDDKLYDKEIVKDIVEEFDKTNSNAIIGFVEILDSTLENLIEVYPHKVIMEFFRESQPTQIFKRLCEHNCLPGPGFSFTKQLIEEYGLYDESYRLVEDYPRYVSLSRNGCRIWFIDRITVKHRYGVGVYSKGTEGKDNAIGEQYKKDKLLSRKKEVDPYINN